jgi:hypothetical protein
MHSTGLDPTQGQRPIRRSGPRYSAWRPARLADPKAKGRSAWPTQWLGPTAKRPTVVGTFGAHDVGMARDDRNRYRCGGVTGASGVMARR